MTASNTAVDGLDLLVQDHREVESMFAQLESMPTGPAAGEDVLAQRKSIVEKVIMELSRHAVAEEMYLYPLVREVLPDGDEQAEHAISEHQEAKNDLSKLDHMSPDNVEFESTLRSLMTEIRHHVDEEENGQFAQLRERCTTEQLQELGSALEKAKKVAPTHPHPLSPNEPPLNKVAAPVAGLVDKAMDKVTGRGKD